MLKIIYRHIMPIAGGWEAWIAWKDGDQRGVECSQAFPSRQEAEAAMPELEALVREEHGISVDSDQLTVEADRG